MREEVPINLIPNGYRNRPGAEVPLDMLPDGVSAIPAKKNKTTELPFKAEHPTLYALGRTVMDMIPGGKYAYEEERKAFLKLPQREQTRQLLKDTAEAELMLAVPNVIKGVGGIVGGITERFAPKTYKFFTKPIGKAKTIIKPTEKTIKEPIESSEIKAKPDLVEPTISGKEVPLDLIPESKPISSELKPIKEPQPLRQVEEVGQPQLGAKAEVGEPLEPLAKEVVKSPFEEAPNLSIDRVEAKKRPDGIWQLFYRGTRNEVFTGEKFQSATDARNYFKVEQAKAKPTGEVGVTPAKTISQFTEEYKGGMGEAGYISIGGKEITPTPKVVTVGTRDIALPEFGLGTLQVADRHPFIKPIIEANIKALQNTNDWTIRYSDRIARAFDKVEKTSLWEQVFGKKGTAISDLDLMIEGKKATPPRLSGFTTEIKGILGDIKGEIINKMKNDFAGSLSPKQKEYLDWVQNGKTGTKPKYVRSGTIKAVDEAFNQFKGMEKWGIQDYFPHIFKGRYKYLNEEGGIIASGQTAKQAKANFEEFVESHPETKDKTFMFVNDFYDLMTVRKILNPELVNPLEYLGTRLSRKEFFRLINKTEKVIKEEIANAGVANVPKVKVDMSGIASFQKGNKFSGHFMRRKTSLRGEETDPFKSIMSYIFSVGRKLGLEDAKKASYAFSDSLPMNMPNAKSYIKMQADNMAGRYNLIDKIFDETIGEKLGMKPFGVSRFTTKAMGLESKAKLGYAPAKTAINRIGGTFHTVLQEGVKNYIGGRSLLKKDPFLMNKIETEGHLAGMEQLFANEGIVGISKTDASLWRPLGAYQRAEIKNRSEALASGYSVGLKKFNGDKDAAWVYAIDSARLTQGLYDIASKPVVVRGPVLQAGYQFKQYLANEIRFMSQLTPKQWAGYIPGMVALSGTRGALLTIKSIIGISVVGMGIDNLMERLNREAPHLHRGIFGLAGFDVSAPASWQIPSSVKDWIGVFPRDLIETGNMAIKGLKNNGWTDEEINDYVRQIVPVGYNVFKGFQMLTEGVQKEGTKTIYKGDKGEGVINLLGAKTVKQSQASDSTRYMNQQRKEFMGKIKVAEDKIFRAKGQKNTEQAFNDFIELKNPQTAQEINDIIEGLRKSAKSKMLTEEQRVFLTLPKRLKREEITRRQ